MDLDPHSVGKGGSGPVLTLDVFRCSLKILQTFEDYYHYFFSNLAILLL
jgi:hypothetical protein